jgi:hypothetical protein
MQTFSLDSEVARGLARRRLARRLNGYSLLALLLIFTVGLAVGFKSWPRLASTLLLIAFIFHGAVAMYMQFAKCPRCRKPFAERNALWYFTSLEDQLTVRCHTCGLPLCADKVPSNSSLERTRDR